ncbi:MAG: Glycosyl transferase group 1 [Candidatus Beckwithbacteria bacterium GW2011_GWB1_47_15]|uniref:Glycosyl transferase group 1 n=1 Tax=Candidatus Beckwithbacteria bacterium GW2011_GWB1_47_15 TaxID=1618371 RepID=A0A0G1RUH0_9BACT|nr:MAG: group 1 glycosyl transferase [Candidatus Beckwithbacteria bacterium GW2011_GWC1_49_16]KKU35715.1 MAG: Glycosyl transferase group 1 [Candidatus Beckwithbacteria bacterium GW2011_GWA1_46_30]KKU60969.1 MAG: Glycosyl transferase group 1 [Candidatus Beckwithbacteria bacterium GW2011_GWB1_47_15]KKU72274.1 MAG: Glycosyl transferase group 1 [Candidatus Beckwithbacteria bacterium GW2011_GWA2_47_25]KKW04966.1 MAG: Glycosyl transferase group 1 [Candidatus Beckwithbacteria bacterium GW2011_GWC2_49_
MPKPDLSIVILADAWHPVVGGGQKLFSKLARGLVKDHRCEITVVTRSLKDAKGKVFDQNQSFFSGKLKIIRLGPALAWPNLFGRVWFTLQSAVYAAKFKPDLFMVSTFLPGLSLQLIKLVNLSPQVLVAIGFGAVNTIYRFLEKFISQTLNYDLIITDDVGFYSQVKSQKKINLILNGVDIPRLKPVKKRSQFTFLFVGRNEPRKGINILRQAFSRLKKIHPGVKLKLIGPGLKLVSRQTLEKELLRCHCLVLPSFKEGHPLILFEAWAHKLPVIATRVGSVPRLVNDTNGYLIDAGNVEALTEAMTKAVENQGLSQMGESGYQLVKSRYSWPKTVSRYYRALISLRQ